MRKKTKKRGELSSSQLVLIIILVISFIVILLFVMKYKWNPTINKESCKESIIFRSSVNFGALELGKEIPLKCETEKICLTVNGEKCIEYPDLKEVAITPVKIGKDKTKAKEKIMETIADALYDCNSMLGEGKLDFMPHSMAARSDYCLICSRLVLDEEAKKLLRNEGIPYGEFYSYLEKRKTPAGLSYFEYIYPGGEAKKVKQVFIAMQENSNNPEFKNLKFEDWKIYPADVESGYAIIAKISPQSTIDKWKKVGYIAVGAVVGVALLPLALPSGIIGVAIFGVASKAIVGGAVAWGGYVFMYEHPNDKYQWVPPNIFPYDLKSLKAMNCTSFEMAP